MAPRTKLTKIERTTLATTAAQRYHNGESWVQIAQDYDLTSTYVRRLTAARHTINYRRWGQRPVADVELVCRLRDEGRTLNEIAEEIGCSRQAVRTALEAAGGTKPTRYPRLSQSRSPTQSELEQTQALYEACPPAPRARPGARNVRGAEGRLLAEACRALVDDGIPMQRLSRALGRGPTWVHWLLSCHDLKPDQHAVRTTSRRTRDPL